MKPLRGRDTNRTSLHFRDLSRQEKEGRKKEKNRKKETWGEGGVKIKGDNFGKSSR